VVDELNDANVGFGSNARKLLLAAGLLIIALLAAVPASQAGGWSGASRERGAALFMDKGCARCHGPNAAEQTDAPRLDDVGRRLKKNAIEKQILDGGKQMPAFKDALTSSETHDLVAYLAHQKGQASVPAQ
jgi:mono/diheme cytochrome c family protein